MFVFKFIQDSLILHKSTTGFTSDGDPSHYPVSLKDVILIPEDPTHYQIYGGLDDSEWRAHFPPGKGRIRLSSNDQIFGVTMFHELRCLGAIRHAITTQATGSVDNANFLHGCFNYLRELVLCRADATLEGVDVDLSVNTAYPHICRDWTALYAALNLVDGY